MTAPAFATPRPGYWQEVAAGCAHDFIQYLVFVMGVMPAEHHLIICERLMFGDPMELILGPPDSGKTTIMVGWASWTLGRNPNYRWLIASEGAVGIATVVTTQIAETLASNERYQMVFGQLRDPRGRGEWSSQSIRVRSYLSPREAARMHLPPTPEPYPWLLEPEPHKPPMATPISPRRGRNAGLAHPNVKAVGWRSGYTGVRCEGILADDLVSDRSSRSQVITETIYTTLHQKLLARLTGDQQRVVILGQRWAPRDLYGMLLESGAVVYDNNPGNEGLHVLEDTPPEEDDEADESLD